MRLIDADALDLDREVELADDWKTAHEISNCVKYAPTVDAAPVVHARWELVGEIREQTLHGVSICAAYDCSVCGSPQTFIDAPPYFLYCPICGAKMKPKV